MKWKRASNTGLYNVYRNFDGNSIWVLGNWNILQCFEIRQTMNSLCFVRKLPRKTQSKTTHALGVTGRVVFCYYSEFVRLFLVYFQFLQRQVYNATKHRLLRYNLRQTFEKGINEISCYLRNSMEKVTWNVSCIVTFALSLIRNKRQYFAGNNFASDLFFISTAVKKYHLLSYNVRQTFEKGKRDISMKTEGKRHVLCELYSHVYNKLYHLRNKMH